MIWKLSTGSAMKSSTIEMCTHWSGISSGPNVISIPPSGMIKSLPSVDAYENHVNHLYKSTCIYHNAKVYALLAVSDNVGARLMVAMKLSSGGRDTDAQTFNSSESPSMTYIRSCFICNSTGKVRDVVGDVALSGLE